MRYDEPVATLLDSAGRGAESSWREIVRRYSPLVFSVCRRHGVTGADAEDVAGNVWLQLVSKLLTIREPEALPGWLATTTRRDCLSLLQYQRRQVPSDREIPTEAASEASAGLIVAERRNAVRIAVAKLSDRDQELLSMLFADPPAPYTEISSTLGMPIGAIGPTRRRCLARVHRALPKAFLGDERHCHSN